MNLTKEERQRLIDELKNQKQITYEQRIYSLRTSKRISR